MPPRVSIPDEAVHTIRSLYECGTYVAAWQHAQALPPFHEWTGADALTIAGRLLNNLDAPRLAHALHARAWRENRGHPDVAYYRASTVARRFGPLRALRFLDALAPLPASAVEQRANFLALRASTLASFRDFERAEALLKEALALDAASPWLWVEHAWCMERSDRYATAVESGQRALELKPWYRPAVQCVAHHLTLLGRDDEALTLLRDASARLESPAVLAQFAALLTEHEHHPEALAAWRRYRELTPPIEHARLEYWHARMSDAHYQLGDLAQAAEHARRAKNGFHEQIAARLAAPPANARVVTLAVPFVRQHEMTCAPATLSAISTFWKTPVDHLALARRICYDGTPGHEERNWAEENGFVVREFRATWETAIALLDRGVPFALATVETSSAHLQAIVGYDGIRGTLFIRDPYQKHPTEAIGDKWIADYAFSGPRSMVFLPKSEAHRLDGIELPEAPLYDLRFQLDRALHRHDRPSAAAALTALESLAPAHRMTLAARRDIAWYDDNQPESLAATEALFALFPESNNLRWTRYHALCDLAHTSERRACLEDLARGKKAEPLFWRAFAIELGTDARQRSDARRWHLRALRASPCDADGLHSYAGLLWEERRFDEATALYRLAACLRDKAEYAQRSWFIAARHFHCEDEVLAVFKARASEHGAISAQPAMILHWALTLIGRAQDASATLEVALARRPSDGALLLFAADHFARNGQRSRADDLLAEAEGKSARAAWLRTAASLADYRGDLRDALRLHRAAVESNPLDCDLQRTTTRLVAEVEGRAAALASVRALIARFPHHLPFRRLLVNWLQDDGPQAEEPAVRDVLAIEPRDAWAVRELAVVLAALGRFDEALEQSRAAIALTPHETNSHNVHGSVLSLAGRRSESADAFREAIRLSVDNSSAIANLIEACDDLATRKGALAFTLGELERQVVFGDGLLSYVTAAYPLLDPDELLANLRAAHGARPDLWHAWSALITQLCDTRHAAEALPLAQDAVARFPLTPRLWYDLGRVHCEQRRFSDEAAALARALELSPTWGKAAREYSECLTRLERYDEAQRVLEQALAAAPLDAANHGFLAEFLWRRTRDPRALDHVAQAVRLEPAYRWAWDQLRDWSPRGENRAVALARELTESRAGEADSWLRLAEVLPDDSLAERLAALDHALDRNPRHIRVHDFRAFLLAEAGRYDEAAAACAPAVFGNAIPRTLAGRAAWVKFSRGNVKGALAAMREVAAAEPDYYWAWECITEWSETIGDHPGQREAAQRMVRLSPRSAIPLGYLAAAEFKLDHRDAALGLLARAFALDPSYGYAGHKIFSAQLEKKELAAARATLTQLQSHLPGPNTLAAEVRLLAAEKSRDAAIARFTELLGVEKRDTHALNTAAEALQKAGWSRQIETAIEACLKNGAPNPATGIIWVKCFASREAWGKRRALYKLDPETEFAREARGEFIERCADRKRIGFLRPLLRRHRDRIRSDTTAWGQVGYALVNSGQYRKAADWLSDWRERKDLEPWMLTNVIVALQHRKRDAEALDVSKFALGLRRDNTTAQHQLWVALGDANRGDTTAARATLSEQHYDSLAGFAQTQWTLVNAICSVAEALPASRRAVLRDHCRELRKPEHAVARKSPGLARGAKAGITRMAREAGISFPRVRAWWFFVSAGIPAMQGSGTKFNFVPLIVAGVLAAISRFSSERPAMSPPSRAPQISATPTAADFQRIVEIKQKHREEEQRKRALPTPGGK